MASQALYRKWRSQSFDDVVGQEHITVTLRNALRDGRMSHAYLFTGPAQVGELLLEGGEVGSDRAELPLDAREDLGLAGGDGRLRRDLASDGLGSSMIAFTGFNLGRHFP